MHRKHSKRTEREIGAASLPRMTASAVSDVASFSIGAVTPSCFASAIFAASARA